MTREELIEKYATDFRDTETILYFTDDLDSLLRDERDAVLEMAARKCAETPAPFNAMFAQLVRSMKSTEASLTISKADLPPTGPDLRSMKSRGA